MSAAEGTGQLGSVMEWLVANRHSRAWLAEKLGRDRVWASRLFLGEISCSVPVLLKLHKLTGLDLKRIAQECVE